MSNAVLRSLVIIVGALALVVIATVHLGALAALIVLPATLILIAGAILVSDLESHGRSLAKACEDHADIERRWNRRGAADQLERAAAILEAFVDDDSAEADIARLRAMAYWDRKRGK